MHASTVSAILLALASLGLAAPSPRSSFTPVPHAPPTPQTNYQVVYRGPGNLHCNNAGPNGYHYNVTTFNPEPDTLYSMCKNFLNPARAFQIGVKPTDNQLTTSFYRDVNDNPLYVVRTLLFFTEPNCQGQSVGTIPEFPTPLGVTVPRPGPPNSTYGTCYESSQLARSAQLLFSTVNAA